MKYGTRWPRISLYYLIAILVSYLARFIWHTGIPTSASAGAGAMYGHLVAGAGPALGVLAVWLVFGYRPTLTFGGTNQLLAAVTITVPALVLGARGVANPFAMDPHLFGLHMGMWIAAYAVLEEIGWRGYMQGEFVDRRPITRYAIVGLFWYVWHLSWVTNPSIAGEIVSVLVLVGAAIGVGFVADRTRSILAAAAFHVLGNIMGMTTDFRTLIPFHERLLLAGVCLVVLIGLLRLWRAGNKAHLSSNSCGESHSQDAA